MDGTIAQRNWHLHKSRCQKSLVTSYILTLVIVDECLIYHAVATGCGIIARKIPVAGIGRAALMQVFDGLVNNLNRDIHFLWGRTE